MKKIIIITVLFFISFKSDAQAPSWLTDWYSYINSTIINGSPGGGTKLVIGNIMDSLAKFAWSHGGSTDTTSINNRINARVSKIDSNIYGSYISFSYYYAHLSSIDTTALSNRINNRVRKIDSNIYGSYVSFSYYYSHLGSIDTTAISNRINLKLNISDTTQIHTQITQKLFITDTIPIHNQIAKSLYRTDSNTIYGTKYGVDTASKNTRNWVYTMSFLTSAVTSVATDATMTGGTITSTGTLGVNTSNNFTWIGTHTFSNTVTYIDAKNIVFGTTTGSKIGTGTSQKIAFYNSTPIVQPSGDILVALSNLGLISGALLPTAGTAGTYGDATHYTTFTTDAYGRVTSVTTYTFSSGGGGGSYTGGGGVNVTGTRISLQPSITYTITAASSVTYTPTVCADSIGDDQVMTANQAITLTIDKTNIKQGHDYYFTIIQDGTGSRVITLNNGTDYYISNGTNGTNILPTSSIPNSVDVYRIRKAANRLNIWYTLNTAH